MRRRTFLKVAGGTALTLAIRFSIDEAHAKTPPTFEPNAWLRIDQNGKVTITINKSEMGQGVMTSLPMLLAEELDVSLSGISVEVALPEPKYNGPGQSMMITGRTSSIAQMYEPMRRAGATARAMLVAVAAKRFGVPPNRCVTENGEVVCGNKRVTYGKLVATAAGTKPPATVELKSEKDFRLLRTAAHRLDTPSKVDGTAIFGIDVKVPGMLTAVVERCPVFGGKLASYEESAAAQVVGVKKILPISTGVAVVAESYWPAMRARRALQVIWDEGKQSDLSSLTIAKMFEESGMTAGKTVRETGSTGNAFKSSAKRISAVYQIPYLAHAPMEPLSCTAHVSSKGVEIWVATEAQTSAQEAAAKAAGVPLAKVKVHTTFAGGGFGRRAETDFVVEAVEISKAVGAPVKVIWSREDEIRHGFYRPGGWSRIEAALDNKGWPIAWIQRIVSPSILSRVSPDAIKNGIDQVAVEGSGFDMPYAIDNVHVDHVMRDPGVPVGFWRSAGHSSNAFVTESFIDEIAVAGGHDPLVLRQKLLNNSPRHLAVLERAAKAANWGAPLEGTRARGIAIHESFGSIVAQVAEVSVDLKESAVRVHRVVCAIDCGKMVNPDIIESQIQGGIVFGLTAALKGAITLQHGRVRESNFHDYQMVRMNEAPIVEVRIIEGGDAVGGVEQPSVPPIAPAVANAIFAAAKKRIRRLPIEPELGKI